MNNLSILVNRSTLKSLTLCLLLTGVLGCRGKTDPVPNLANCRIVREVYKTRWYGGSSPSTETVTAGGESYKVVAVRESVYSYDELGRISTETITLLANGEVTRIAYTYGPSVIFKETKFPSYTLTDTIRLNAQGLAERNVNYIRYDDNGNITEYYNNGATLQRFYYEKGNLIQARYAVNTETVIDQYEYDLSRPNLPNKYPFYGKASQNLPIKYTQSSEASIYYSPGPLSEKSSGYTFDTYGRVIRRVNIGVNLNPRWPGQSDPDGFGVTDFEYECL